MVNYRWFRVPMAGGQWWGQHSKVSGPGPSERGVIWQHLWYETNAARPTCGSHNLCTLGTTSLVLTRTRHRADAESILLWVRRSETEHDDGRGRGLRVQQWPRPDHPLQQSDHMGPHEPCEDQDGQVSQHFNKWKQKMLDWYLRCCNFGELSLFIHKAGYSCLFTRH